MMKLKVPDMSCGHCAATIEKAARSVDPAAEFDVDLTTKVATIGTTAPADRMRSAIRDAGYDNQPIDD
ncbi:MAG: heavy-metal-associated domain-containing protein [bacterium]